MNITVIENDNIEGSDRVRVHGSACKDVAKDAGMDHTYVTELNVDSRDAVIREIFANEMDEDSDPVDFAEELKFLPCCKLK